MKKTIGFFVFFFLVRFSYSQSMRSSEIGFIAGGAYYIGDLNNQQFINDLYTTAGILYRYPINDRWVIKAQGIYGKIEQLKDINPERNLGFKSHLFEFSGQFEFNFLPFLSEASYYFSTPYIFWGMGVFGFNPLGTLGDGQWHELRQFRTEGQDSEAYPKRKMYSTLQICMPFGIGVKCYLTKSICVGLEWGLRKTWTDYMDDVSTTYVDEEILLNSGGDLAVELSDRGNTSLHTTGNQRGNPALKDWYGFIAATFTVKINHFWNKPKCNK